ncbi:Probable carotenoid cleavage dioxygenase 4-chloroplastic [Striga hermonthica]|uniref:Probable carotenoid cleavage dioxygenase 4-chloroplastic n=1 Tax=Striga hermonthica TaxID=68872 RepID=A0A9N7NXE3_STRHE|nr:Probable carotenoid cleavage dioxygenase 4-chloroplastic [Striga hermonthica]
MLKTTHGHHYPPFSKLIIKSSSSLFPTFINKPIEKLLKTTHQTLGIKKLLKTTHQTLDNGGRPHVDSIFDTLDSLIRRYLDPSLLPSSIEPHRVLSDTMFSSCDELPPTSCLAVEGFVPPCLDGIYIRNGPNPRFPPRGPYHLLDGDGMLHTIRISRGRATFCSRYVRTHKFETEHAAGRPVIPNFFAFSGAPVLATAARLVVAAAWSALTGRFDPIKNGFGVANTSVALLGGRLLAMCESDLPYEVKVAEDGDVVTLGRYDFSHDTDGEQFPRMTAHPKIDPETGDAFAYTYDVVRPYLTFYRIERGLIKGKGVPVRLMSECTIVHDFGLTEAHVVFSDGQMVVNPIWMLKGRPPVGVVTEKVPRLGIIEKRATDDRDMVWVDAPGFNMVHCVNAWDEDDGDTIILVASNLTSVEHFIGEIEHTKPMLEKVTIDVKGKRLRSRKLLTAQFFLDLAVVNSAYVSKKSKYVYATVLGGKSYEGVVKLDVSLMDDEINEGSCEDCIVASRLYGPGCYGGEPFFVAREPDNPAADEDDGYLVTYVHDENVQESKFVVMDAKSPTLDIVAAVKLPHRVPAGLHGVFVPESELKKL